MDILPQRIIREGKCLKGDILKVDSFINHQVDPNLMKSIADEFARRFRDLRFNKIITIEASGIAPAIMTGYVMGLPVVFIKKDNPGTMHNVLCAQVYSFTKNKTYDVCVSRDFITPNDTFLFIDDFLAHGNAAFAVKKIIEESDAKLAGMGFIIEKSFQAGGKKLRDAGIRVESLVKIKSLSNHIEFEE